MVQTIRPDRREGDRRKGDRRAAVPPTDAADIDGVVYRLGRLQRVLVDVSGQVREMRTFATAARADTDLDSDAAANIARRLDALDEVIEAVRNDFDVARDAIDKLLDDTTLADVISLGDRSLAAGA